VGYPLLLTALLLTLCASCTSPTLIPRPTPALVRVTATDLTWPLLLDLSAAYGTVNLNVAVAPSRALDAALAGMLAAGQTDLALTTAPDPKLFATPIGYLPFQVVVHPSNTLTMLSLAQAQALFDGRITDWSQVGGPAGPVQVVARGTGGDAARAFGATAMGPFTVTANALLAPTWDAMHDLVGQNPGSIGYLISPKLDASVKTIALAGGDGAPAALRVLAVAVAVNDPAGAARDFLAWAQSPAGQAVVARRNVAFKP
jgi:phosphate transport system substrate-binding protein